MRNLLTWTLTVTAVAMIGAIPLESSVAAPKVRYCATFKGPYPGERIVVRRQGKLTSCRTAIRIIKDFRGNRKASTRHGDGTLAGSYYTVAGWPGWRCYEGGAAGSCRRGSKVATYEVRIT